MLGQIQQFGAGKLRVLAHEPRIAGIFGQLRLGGLGLRGSGFESAALRPKSLDMKGLWAWGVQGRGKHAWSLAPPVFLTCSTVSRHSNIRAVLCIYRSVPLLRVYIP